MRMNVKNRGMFSGLLAMATLLCGSARATTWHVNGTTGNDVAAAARRRRRTPRRACGVVVCSRRSLATTTRTPAVRSMARATPP